MLTGICGRLLLAEHCYGSPRIHEDLLEDDCSVGATVQGCPNDHDRTAARLTSSTSARRSAATSASNAGPVATGSPPTTVARTAVNVSRSACSPRRPRPAPGTAAVIATIFFSSSPDPITQSIAFFSAPGRLKPYSGAAMSTASLLACRRGDFRNCEHLQVPGISYDGGYQQYMIAPAEALVSIPESLQDVEAAPLLCAGITTYNALRHSGAFPGDLVAVQGIGGLGHLGIQFANKFGYRVAAIGRGSDTAALATQLGASVYIDSTSAKPADGLQQLGGAQVILATALNSKAMSELIDGLAPNGRLIVVGATSDPKLEPSSLPARCVDCTPFHPTGCVVAHGALK